MTPGLVVSVAFENGRHFPSFEVARCSQSDQFDVEEDELHCSKSKAAPSCKVEVTEPKTMEVEENSVTIVPLDCPEQKKASPEENAGLLSRSFFMWATEIFHVASRKIKTEGRELDQEDLWDLPSIDQTNEVSEKFANAWKTESQGHEKGKQATDLLTFSLWKVVGKRMIRGGVFKFLSSSLQLSYPLFINSILQYINSIGTDEYPRYHGYLWAASFGLVLALRATCENSYLFNTFRAGWQARSIITTEVYRKSLRLSASARQNLTIGQIVNLMQLDSTKIEFFLSNSFHALWDAFYEVLGYLVILYFYIGVSAFIGIGVMLLVIPFQTYMFQRVAKLNRKMARVTDNRVKVTNEVLQGILGIKMAGWELNFIKSIDSYRTTEVAFLRSTVFLTAISMAIVMTMPAIVALAALSSYAVLNDGQVDATTLFTALSAFTQLRVPLMLFPNALSQLAQAKVSRKRIADFLILEEVVQPSLGDVPSVQHEDKSSNSFNSTERPVIEVRDGVFFWNVTSPPPAHPSQPSQKSAKKTGKIQIARKSPFISRGFGDGVSIHVDRTLSKSSTSLEPPQSTVLQTIVTPVLSNVNLALAKGSLVAVVGPVGSGKTSLVNAIINELRRTQGTVYVHGSIAYAAQTPWIFNASLRANILFEEPFDEARYRKVLKVCQLEHDLGILPDGDMTIIGERGINLSGGQKQRVSVARAAYSCKDIIIFDDPLSALDPEVANRMFHKCISEFLSGRTRLLVTNQLSILPQCDELIVLRADEEGTSRIVEKGTYASLIQSGLDFAKLMESFHGLEAQPDHSHETLLLESTDTKLPLDGSLVETKQRPSSSQAINVKDIVQSRKGNQLMQVEERQRGAVAKSEYLGYLKAGGGFAYGTLLLFIFIITQTSNLVNTAWVAFWSSDTDYENFPIEFYLGGYAITAVVLAGLNLMRTIGMAVFGLNASKSMHQALLQSVLHAPMSFFDTTPIGRIVSRFSKDLFLVDTRVPVFTRFFFFTAISLIFSLLTVAYSTPLFLIAVPFLGSIYFYMLNMYRPLARDAKRLESISRSPIFAHFSETLGGLSTIRSYNQSASYQKKNSSKVDENMKAWYLVKVIERWLAIRLELLGSIVTSIAACLAVYGSEQGTLSAGLAGLSLTFSLSITNLLNNTVRTFAEFEAGMNSVERVLHYSKGIEQEAPYTSSSPPSESWPRQGKLVIKGLRMRYRDNTPLVLKGINLVIEDGQKVGVCGRTGSGKSSLLLCLLRLVEPELHEDGSGPILLDDIDTCTIGLHELRSHISIVPQSPVMFSGTVRWNLDPFNQFSDDEIWKALGECEMKKAVTESGGLQGKVSEYGENFSQGQRQLLCLARSILTRTKILLLDEATSSLDYQTDLAIQRSIRTSFHHCTIITIAHRLNTIIDSDKILVLSEGTVAEFDHPATLLRTPGTHFSSMVAELGPEKSSHLRALANQSEINRQIPPQCN